MTDCVINPSDGSSIVRAGAARASRHKLFPTV
jgi:hypothetical protein